MNNKNKVVYVCNECGYESPKWLGNCPSCSSWNSFVEQTVKKNIYKNSIHNSTKDPKLLSQIIFDEQSRINTKSIELNRVLGGGIVPGSVILIGGEPGIGKSTLMLQFALRVSSLKSLYVSGEESESQLKLRAQRIGGKATSCLLLCDIQLENIINQIEQHQPDIVIIDSIQTIQSENVESFPGSISQVRYCTAEFIKLAKTKKIPIFIIGHINKEGAIAGPKVLEHMVDTVLLFEGEHEHSYRILRSIKNRYGSKQVEIGIFEMRQEGLKEVPNPSELLINEATEGLSGSCIASTIEGIRPIMIEVQALVSPNFNNFPQRVANGYDTKTIIFNARSIRKTIKHQIAQ